MYVSDPSYNIYVGIKQKGRFQHSSFLGGGPITSAGTLVIREGKVIDISPHSGHYRVNTKYFKAFVEELEAKGVDLEEVKIGKTEVSRCHRLFNTTAYPSLHAICIEVCILVPQSLMCQ